MCLRDDKNAAFIYVHHLSPLQASMENVMLFAHISCNLFLIHHFTVPRCVEMRRSDLGRRVTEHGQFGTITGSLLLRGVYSLFLGVSKCVEGT